MKRSFVRQSSLVQCLHATSSSQGLTLLRSPPTVWARGGRRLISGDFQPAKFHSGVSASRRRHCKELQAPHIECPLDCSGPFTTSAVTVEGDRTDRELDSLHFFVTVHCSFAKNDGFQWPDKPESFFLQISYRERTQRRLHCKA